MPSSPDPTEPELLRIEQERRARAEAERAEQAVEPDEARAHLRRADKAAYLRDRLAEQSEAPDE